MRKERPTRLVVAGQDFKKERDYWLKQLSGELEIINFPYDYKRSCRKGGEIAVISFRLTPELSYQLIKISGNVDARLHIILLTGVLVLLHRYTGSDDLTIGVPIYKQEKKGEFINTVLVIRNQLAPTIPFRELLTQVKKTMVEAVKHQNYPIEKLPKRFTAHSNKEDSPLFDTVVLMKNIHDKSYIQNTGCNLIFCFSRIGDRVEGTVEYNSLLFKQESIINIAEQLERLLHNGLSAGDTNIADIDIHSEEEKKQLLVDFNHTRTGRIFTRPIHILFEEQVEKTPNNRAITGTQLTYGKLNIRVNQLSRLLRRTGVGDGSVAGIMMKPSADMLVGLIAILKTGAAYLPIDTGTPGKRLHYMLNDTGAKILITQTESMDGIPFTTLRNFESRGNLRIKVTPPRTHIEKLDSLPMPDRSLIDLKKYRGKIGMASVTNCISLQATRGCPYHCLFCHKIWSKHHVYRSAENIYDEIEFYYKNGVTNFAFIDDCFNLNRKKSDRLFQMIVAHKLDLQLFFPNGLRGDILTPDYIDRMVEAGTRGINLSLETASPRLQKLLGKNLDLDKFKKVMDYIAASHPEVILEIASMHGFPTETEEEAIMTMDFIKSIKWIHFPYIHILKIFPNTDMERFALEHGISKTDILISKDRAFHELPETLPWPKSFTRKYQADFLNQYFLSKERLTHVLPYQMKVLNESALAQKYNAYLPVEIKNIADLIEFAQLENVRISEEIENQKDTHESIFDRSAVIREASFEVKKILFLDLSQHFSSQRMRYRVLEQPLGLISLLTYLKQQFGDRIDGRIYKSGIDFDSMEELRILVENYWPDMIGIRTLTFFKDFFHETAALLRLWGFKVPIITGGPYASSDYDTILKDKNIDLVVLGEGEHTLVQLIGKMLANGFELPDQDELKRINGIAYTEKLTAPETSHDIILLDHLKTVIAAEESENPEGSRDENSLAYAMYTSGSTGNPKGVLVEHRQINNCISWMQEKFCLKHTDIVVHRTNLTFDPSVWEIFWPLAIGAGIKILDSYQRKDAEYLIDLMSERPGLSIMYCPATLISLMTHLLKTRTIKPRLKMHWLVIGAEPIAREVVKQFYTYFDGRIVNTYGPTECTINNTYCDLYPNDIRPVVPIGKPVANNQIYIMDRSFRLTPPGLDGEICIAGDSVARGYLNKPETTGNVFIRNPFGKGPLFKTGDIGCWSEEGNIEIMGRIDEQVKIRGYRIEPGEIEAVISAHPSVNECVVVAKKRGESEKKITECKSCGITTQYPGITVDKDGLCSGCESYRQYKGPLANYFKSLDQLKQELEKANQNRQSQYDCLLLYAGGLGAAYALYQLVEMGYRVLALTYDNGYLGEGDLENLKTITKSLDVDHVVLNHRNSDKILGESIKIAATVCRGCFHTSSTLAGEYALRHGINVVVGATLSRGQIIENKLLMFLQQGITDANELEREIAKIQSSAPDIDRTIFEYIDIDKKVYTSVHEKIKFIDFYRYCDISNRQMITYLNDRGKYWKTRKDFAVYSTNCPIKQLGDYGHLQKKGYHYYGAATSWEARLKHLTLEDVERDLTCKATNQGYEKFLYRIGLNVPVKSGSDDKYLCAYLLPRNREISVPELREYLKTKLPEFMIPSYFVQMKTFPLLTSGKIDKKSLPEPQRSASMKKATYVAPKSDLEISIINIWKEVLNIDVVSTQDNFFDLGGTSIDIIKVGGRLREILDRDIPAVTLFTYPKIESLAGFLTENFRNDTQSKIKEQRIDKMNKAQDKAKKTVSRIKRQRKEL